MSKAMIFLKALGNQDRFPWQNAAIAPRVEVVDQYRLEASVLAGRKAVIMTMHQDQRFLKSRQHVLENFISTGGVLVVQGQVAIPFLECLSVFQPLPKATPQACALQFAHPVHPLFRGLDPQALAVRKGVSGFYARGCSAPPASADILTRMDSGRCPVDWVDRQGDGMLFMHPGNDLWTTYADDDANIALTLRLLDWLESWPSDQGTNRGGTP